MTRPLCLLVLLCAGGLLLTGCAGPERATQSADRSFPADYERVTTPSFTVRNDDGTVLSNPFYGGFNTPRPQFVDVTGDGNEDLFVQERGGQISFFEHVTEGDSSRLVWRTDTYHDLDVGEWFRFADLDQDGTPDLLAEQPYSHIRAYRNTGTPTEPNFEPFRDTLRTPAGEPIFSDRQNIPNVTDIDCDGRLDLFLGRLDGTITRYEAAGDSAGMPQFAHVTDNFENIEIVNQQIGVRHGANTLTFADIDEDGQEDLFWGDFFEPGLLLIENTGSCDNPILTGEPEPFPPSNPLRTSGYNAPTLTDWTGNGRLDLFVGVLGGADDANESLAENFYFYAHTDDGYELRTRQFAGGLDVGSESKVAVGDLDGDGAADALVANKIDPSAGETARLYRLRNTGSADAPAFRLGDPVSGLPATYHYAPALGDLTDNGAADLVLGTWKGEVLYRPNSGDGSFESAGDAALVQPDGRHVVPALGDLNGDGRLDLVVGTADGSLLAYRNTGSPSAPDFERMPDLLSAVDVGRRAAPTLHDVDGDGAPDLIVGTEEGLSLLRNTGSASAPDFADAPTSLFPKHSPRFANPAVGALSGTGHPDLVVGTERGGLMLFQPQSSR